MPFRILKVFLSTEVGFYRQNNALSKLGYLSSSYFFADALFIIPAGILLDRYSTRTITLIVMTACVISTYVFASTHSYTIALVCRAITGAGNAFAFLASMQLAARWLPPKRLALGIGLIITIIMLGGIIAQTPLTLLIKNIGWRKAILGNASVGLVFLAYMWIVLRDYPKGSKPARPKGQRLFTNLLLSVRSKQNWLCGSYTGFMNLPISLLGELWGVIYLTQARHLSTTQAANIASMMFIGMIIGSPAMGWLSDKFQRRRTPMVVSAALILIVVLLITYANISSVSILMALFFFLGLLASAQVLSYPTIAESNPATVTGTAMSIVAIMLNLASFIAQPLFGALMDGGSGKVTVKATAIYAPSDFYLAMLLLPAAFLISLILAAFIKETFCKPFSPPIDHL